MAYVSLEIAKKHCNVDSSYEDDDTYITSLIDVAETVVSKEIGESLSDLVVDGKLPSPLVQAMLLLIGNFYANREPVAFVNVSELPLSYKHLISLYRNYAK